MGLDKQFPYTISRPDGAAYIDSKLPPEKPPLTINVGWTLRLALAAFSTTIGAAIPVGYSLGVINMPAVIIKQWCNETMNEVHHVHLSEPGMEILWSLVVSMIIVGGMVGSLSGSVIADKIGRKGTVVLAKVCFLISAGLFFSAKPLKSIEFFLTGRLIAGFGSGLITAIMPMYLAELAPMTLQGAAGTLCPVGLSFGVAIAQVLGLNSLLGTFDNWNILLSFYVVLVLISMFMLPWMCESPKYLDSVRKDRMKAIKELCKLRQLPPEVVIHELEDVKDNGNQGEKWSIFRLLCSRELRINLALVCALQAGQQLSGINAVFFYSTSIFEKAGISSAHAQYASLGASFLNLALAVIMIPVLTHKPRRFVALLSTSLSTLCLVFLAIFILEMGTHPMFSPLAVAGVLSYVVCYGLGLGPIPYFIGAELFEVGPRPSAMALGSLSNWFSNLLVGMTFLTVQSLIGAYAFLIFAGFTGLLTIFLHLFLPETNAKILAERQN